MQHFDVLIVGGGLVGLSLARALADCEIRIAVVSEKPIQTTLSAEPELRVSAINLKNRTHFEQLGVWQHLPKDRQCAYTDMHVWEQDSFAAIHFNASDLHVEHLGTIVENQALINALAEVVSTQTNVSVFDDTSIEKLSLGDARQAIVLASGQLLSGSLIVGADGANSLVRRTANMPLTSGEYGQTAIVATVKTERKHGRVARQVFTPHGPLALLPLHNEHLCSIVWSQSTDIANHLLTVSEREFNQRISVCSNLINGKIELVSERASFPLIRQYAREWVAEGVVLCGDSAHTFHPLAGQGANLGFDDAWHLADVLKHISNTSSEKQDFSAQHHYRGYERSRKAAAVAMLGAMEGFHRIFTGEQSVKKGLRGLALSIADKAVPLKTTLAKKALGL